MLRVGVIGVGNMGSQHLRVYGELPSKCDLVAFAEADPHRRESIMRSRGVEPFSDYEELIKKADLDAVSIALPNEQHAKASVECLKRGIDVLVEKPIALTVDDASNMVSVAKETNRILMVGHVERFNPAIQFVRKYVADGKLGALYSLSSRRLGFYPSRRYASQNYGVALDLAIHDVDAMRYITGRPATLVHRDSMAALSDADDYVSLSLRFGEAAGLVEASWLSPYKIRQLVVNGEEGLATVDYMEQTVEIVGAHKEKAEYSGYRDFADFDYEIKRPAIRRAEPLKIELGHFLECVSTRTPTVSDGLNGLENLRIVV